MFVDKAISLPLSGAPEMCFTWVGYGLTHKHKTWPKKLTRGKRSSLSWKGVTDDCKKFYNIGPRPQGRVFNSRRCRVYDMRLLTKWPNLEFKTWLKQLLGSLLLYIAFSGIRFPAGVVWPMPIWKVKHFVFYCDLPVLNNQAITMHRTREWALTDLAGKNCPKILNLIGPNKASYEH